MPESPAEYKQDSCEDLKTFYVLRKYNASIQWKRFALFAQVVTFPCNPTLCIVPEENSDKVLSRAQEGGRQNSLGLLDFLRWSCHVSLAIAVILHCLAVSACHVLCMVIRQQQGCYQDFKAQVEVESE